MITNCNKGNESFWGYKEEVKNILEKRFHAFITIKPNSMEPERDFSATGPFVTKLRNRLNGKSALWLSCVSIINIIEKLLTLTNNSLIYAGNNNIISNDIEFLSLKIAFCFITRKKRVFPGSFSQLPETRVLKFCPELETLIVYWHHHCIVLVSSWNSFEFAKHYPMLWTFLNFHKVFHTN